MVRLLGQARTFGVSMLLLGLAVPVAGAHGQTEKSATIRGEVRTSSGAPVTDALVQLEQEGAEASRARTLGNGNFTLPRLTPGTYVLTVRRLGYATDRRDITLAAGVNRVTAVLTEMAAQSTKDVSLSDGFTGLTGTVGDFELMAPLKGVTISRMGGGEPVTSDADGRFVLPIEEPGVGAILVQRPDFGPRLFSYKLNDGERRELNLVIDSGSVTKAADWILRDLDLRSKFGGQRTVRVPRSEIVATQARNLLVALEQSPSVIESGVVFTRAACVFVNGLPRPGYPIDAINADQVEYVEGFPRNAELSRTLVIRWPANGVCGAPGGDPALRRAIESGQGAQFVSVWLR